MKRTKEQIAKDNKAKYDERKANHQCVWCGKIDERTLSGKTLCFEHVVRTSKHAHKYREKLVKENRCIYCGKPKEPDRINKVSCLACSIKHTKFIKDKRNKENVH